MKNILNKTILLLALIGLSFNSVKAQYVTIPDANFAAWLNANYPGCMNGNLMDTTCAGIVGANNVEVGGLGISDLTGIRYFDNLQLLNCCCNQLSTLAALPSSLNTLWCASNQLTTLPPLPNTINEIDCSFNYLTNLPALPNSIYSFICSNNQLTSLPSLPANLNKLGCGVNNLTSIPTLPDYMTEFYCESNQLTVLPSMPLNLVNLQFNNNQISSCPILPSTLSFLYCSSNPLMSLPTLPPALGALYCENNQLSNLPVLPSQLVELKCSQNQLNVLPALPGNLLRLHCFTNQLTTLPALPNTIIDLQCGNNLLTSLSQLPIGLQTFACEINLITSLPVLPSSLINLTCSFNQLSTIPVLPNAITKLICNNNNISCFPVLPISLNNVNFFNISNNPFYCLPNYVTAMNAATLSIPLCLYNDLINNPNGCNGAAGITGSLYQDNNLNCILGATDNAIHNIKVNFYNAITNQFGSTYSAVNGVYSYPASAGTYIVSIDTLNKPYKVNCLTPGVDSTVITTAVIPLITNVNFDIACKPGFDLNVQSVNHKDGLVFPGEEHAMQVIAGEANQWYGLNCGTGISGQVQITITGPVTYNGVPNGALTPTINGNVYSYTISDFGAINNANDFQFLFTTDTSAQAGDQICVHVEVTPVSGDINPINNIKDYCYSVVNSYDPNYKEVYPKDVPPLFQDWLTYTIHFQNLGTAPAINIRLLDTLDSNLDAETFELINYSHYNTVTLMDSILDFRFPNILLPHSASNPAGSQGFVQYRIKPNANLIAGTQVENTAHIYFDYNPAVVTNTTVNNFITTVNTISSSPKGRTEVGIYPNPSTGIFTISTATNIEVYNLVGEFILSEQNATSIDLTDAPKGMYFVRLNGNTIKKLIKN